MSNNQIKVAEITDDGNDNILVPVVPVVVNRSCNALALLDSASNSTFFTKDLISAE